MQHGLPEQAIETTATRAGGSRLGYRAVKRAFDLLAAALALIVLSPLFLILSAIVYLGDPGAVIYGQVRIGKNGKPFKMWKFRSMYRNADQMIDQLTEEQKRQYHTEFKIDNDPRITPVGNFLRKTSLDELPQLFNVLAGEMSLVGPRPLLSVKPGVTGYWQAYARNNATYQSGHRQEMEMTYIRQASVWLDCKILLKTVVSVLRRDGAK